MGVPKGMSNALLVKQDNGVTYKKSLLNAGFKKLDLGVMVNVFLPQHH